MGSAQVNIWPKFRENPPRGKEDSEWTRNSRLKPMTLNCDLTLSRHGWVIDSKVNIWPKFKENLSTGIGDTERTWNSRLKPVTLNCDLDLVSAWLSYEFSTSSHWANIWPKFKENPSRGIGDMERTRNSRLKPMTMTCDLELAWLTCGFCTLTHWANIWLKFHENLSKGSGDMERTRKCYKRTDGRTDGQTKAISIISHLLRSGGLIKAMTQYTDTDQTARIWAFLEQCRSLILLLLGLWLSQQTTNDIFCEYFSLKVGLLILY